MNPVAVSANLPIGFDVLSVKHRRGIGPHQSLSDQTVLHPRRAYLIVWDVVIKLINKDPNFCIRRFSCGLVLDNWRDINHYPFPMNLAWFFRYLHLLECDSPIIEAIFVILDPARPKFEILALSIKKKLLELEYRPHPEVADGLVRNQPYGLIKFDTESSVIRCTDESMCNRHFNIEFHFPILEYWVEDETTIARLKEETWVDAIFDMMKGNIKWYWKKLDRMGQERRMRLKKARADLEVTVVLKN